MFLHVPKVFKLGFEITKINRTLWYIIVEKKNITVYKVKYCYCFYVKNLTKLYIAEQECVKVTVVKANCLRLYL